MKERKPRSPRLSREQKAELRRQLPALLESAATNAEARPATVKACLATQTPVPPTLLDPWVLASSLTGQELLAALGRLATRTVTHDFSAALSALRSRLDRELTSGETTRQKLVRLAATTPQKILRVAMGSGKPRRQRSAVPPVFVTPATIAALADLAAWTVKTATAGRSRSPADPRSVAAPWIAAVDALWQRVSADTDARVLAQFWREISLAVGPAALGSVRADSRVAAFLSRKREAVRLTAITAFQQGRIDTLRSLEALHAGEEADWNGVLEYFRSTCTSSGATIPETSLDWLSRQSEEATPRNLTAADESQSAALEYAAAALIAAWDAIKEGPRSRETYEAVQGLARALFRLELVGAPGDIVPFDELQQELLGASKERPVTVKLIRPGIRWSDGIRSRTVVRATAESA